jgi:hypothetical protein
MVGVRYSSGGVGFSAKLDDDLVLGFGVFAGEHELDAFMDCPTEDQGGVLGVGFTMEDEVVVRRRWGIW